MRRGHDLRLRGFLRPWLLAAAVDATDAATLALGLAAIGQRPTPAATLAGTEVGTLFTSAPRSSRASARSNSR